MPSPAPMASAETLAEPLRSRWSPSIFDEHHRLAPEEIETLLRAVQWAPSWGNSQPWAFLVAERGGESHRLLVTHLSRGNAGWVPRASVVLITAAQVVADPQDPDAKPVRDPAYSFHDLGQAAAHLTLQARAMGLHAHQFAGFDRDGVAAALGVPDHYRVLTGIAVGLHGDPEDVEESLRQREQRERRRKPLASFVHGAAWGRPWGGGE